VERRRVVVSAGCRDDWPFLGGKREQLQLSALQQPPAVRTRRFLSGWVRHIEGSSLFPPGQSGTAARAFDARDHGGVYGVKVCAMPAQHLLNAP
jgi:hypothetical protein